MSVFTLCNVKTLLFDYYIFLGCADALCLLSFLRTLSTQQPLKRNQTESFGKWTGLCASNSRWANITCGHTNVIHASCFSSMRLACRMKMSDRSRRAFYKSHHHTVLHVSIRPLWVGNASICRWRDVTYSTVGLS